MKKMLSLMLVLCMTVSLVALSPITAFAATEPMIADYGYLDESGNVIRTLSDEAQVRGFARVVNHSGNTAEVGTLMLAYYEDDLLTMTKTKEVIVDGDTLEIVVATEPIVVSADAVNPRFCVYLMEDTENITPIVSLYPLADELPDASADGDLYADEIDLLKAFDILRDEEDGEFHAAMPVMREKLAEAIVHFVNQQKVANRLEIDPVAPDVNAAHPYAPYLYYAFEKGYIEADHVGRLLPQKPATVKEACFAVVKALGYLDSFENAYQKASDLGLLNKLDCYETELISKGKLAKILEAALDVPMMMQSSFGTNEEWKIQDGYNNTTRKTALSECFSVVKLEGIIESSSQFDSAKDVIVTLKINNNYNTKFDDEFPESTSSKSSKKTLLVGNSDAEDCVGYNVIVYVLYDSTSAEDPEILVCRKNINSADELTISIDDLELVGSPVYNSRVDGNTVEYWGDSKEKTEKIIVAAYSSVMVNGISCDYDIEELFTGDVEGNPVSELLAGKAGTITFLLSGESDSDYNKIFINSYINFVVDSVDTEAMTVTAKESGDYYLDEIIYNTANTAWRSALVDEEGNTLEWASLKKNDVLSVKAAEGMYVTVIKAVLSTKTVEGIVAAIDGSKCQIGEDWYDMDTATIPGVPESGFEGIFYLDMFGRIAYYTGV